MSIEFTRRMLASAEVFLRESETEHREHPEDQAATLQWASDLKLVDFWREELAKELKQTVPALDAAG